MKRNKFGDGNFYHVYNRGTDKRNVFIDKEDFERFLESVRLFNTSEPLGGLYALSLLGRSHVKQNPRRPTSSEKLVNIVCYCLNPNHFHLILEQLTEGGVSEFMKRLGGYTKYFNHKYKRSGVLFQGKFKSVHIDSNEYLLHASVYVNLNNQVHQLKQKEFLSSWIEYTTPSAVGLCSSDIIVGQFHDREEYKRFAQDSLNDILERKELARELES